ncbi:MAG: SAM-dependent methyltransferase [Mycobacterium sp.]
MSVTPADSDIARDMDTGAGMVATVLAAARAAATARGLSNDPFAAPLVQVAGIEFCVRVADGELDLARLGNDGGFPRLAELSAARTRFFDGFCTDIARAGIGQAVILGSGLDTRAYRLWWPGDTTVYEVDQPGIIDFKNTAMRDWGVRPTVDRRAVGIDLRGDWPTALRRVGFDTTVPTAWIVEGLLVGLLPPDAQDRLLDGVNGLSAPGSRFAADLPVESSRSQAAHRISLVDRWRRRGLDVPTVVGGGYLGDLHNVVHQLADFGWETNEVGIAELFDAARLPRLSPRELDGAPAAVGYLTALRP